MLGRLEKSLQGGVDPPGLLPQRLCPRPCLPGQHTGPAQTWCLATAAPRQGSYCPSRADTPRIWPLGLGGVQPAIREQHPVCRCPSKEGWGAAGVLESLPISICADLAPTHRTQDSKWPVPKVLKGPACHLPRVA